MDIIKIFKKLLNNDNEIILEKEEMIELFKIPKYLEKKYPKI